jgi:hypothetical protein
MKPDRSNYEIWLIDWLDGRLNDQQVELLRLFLDENPDLKKEAESLSLSTLQPSPVTFENKHKLKKSPADLDRTQLEYLAVAWLENDLNEQQANELRHALELNPENRKLFDSIQKIKLVPRKVEYNYKTRLKKRRTGARILSLSFSGLAAAAAIAILILSIIFIPRYFSGNDITMQNMVPDTHNIRPFVVRAEILTAPAVNNINRQAHQSNNSSSDKKIIDALAVNTDKDITVTDSAFREKIIQINKINYLPQAENVFFTSTPIIASLISADIPVEKPSFNPVDEDRSRLGKFIARTLRQKVLNDKIPDETPLKGYEIAEVGIESLNKLLGWEMALVRTNDTNGDIKSLYFSSKVLKFNAPVKKTQPAP